MYKYKMLTIVYNVILLVAGLFIIYTGNLARVLVNENNLDNEDSTISNNALFISQLIIGCIIVIFGGYQIYNSYTNRII